MTNLGNHKDSYDTSTITADKLIGFDMNAIYLVIQYFEGLAADRFKFLPA